MIHCIFCRHCWCTIYVCITCCTFVCCDMKHFTVCYRCMYLLDKVTCDVKCIICCAFLPPVDTELVQLALDGDRLRHSTVPQISPLATQGSRSPHNIGQRSKSPSKPTESPLVTAERSPNRSGERSHSRQLESSRLLSEIDKRSRLQNEKLNERSYSKPAETDKSARKLLEPAVVKPEPNRRRRPRASQPKNEKSPIPKIEVTFQEEVTVHDLEPDPEPVYDNAIPVAPKRRSKKRASCDGSNGL